MFLVLVVLLLKILWVGHVFQQESPAEERIWNGWQVSSIHDIPYFAGLVHPLIWFNHSASIIVHCGGTIIYDRWVVTAASCVGSAWNEREMVSDNKVISAWKVLIGVTHVTNDLRSMPAKRDTFVKEVLEILRHPDYLGNENGRQSDLAMVKLRRRLTIVTGIIAPVSVMHSEYAQQGDVYVVTGFGRKRSDLDYANKPISTIQKIKNNSWCEYAFKVPEYGANKNVALFNSSVHICADGNLSHTCVGDFGGGLVGYPNMQQLDFEKYHPKNGKLMGILSWTPTFGGCGIVLPSVYTRITRRMTDWIRYTFESWDAEEW